MTGAGETGGRGARTQGLQERRVDSEQRGVVGDILVAVVDDFERVVVAFDDGAGGRPEVEALVGKRG